MEGEGCVVEWVGVGRVGGWHCVRSLKVPNIAEILFPSWM